jgi:singapore isolate B (sub-type 7) whole genome shotgun sequence assembly, scaffold_26
MISTYNALLTTAYFLGTIIGSIMWGWIADRIGRKTALIITLCCRFSHLLSLLVNVVVLYLFGMCSHIKPAIILRVIHGIVDGIVPVSKTIQAEIANSENIAFVSSLFFVGGAIGGSSFVSPLL